MDITFLAPCKDLSGGIKVIAKYGNLLVDRGHTVNIVYPRREIPFRRELKQKLISLLKNHKDHLDYFKGNLMMVDEVDNETVPDAQILVATAWETAEWAQSLTQAKGSKFYLIQGYETWNADNDLVDKTLKLPFTKITISTWLQDLVQEISGDKEVALVPNGSDFNYHESEITGNDREYSVGMTWSSIANKGSRYGLEAIHQLGQDNPNLKFVIFGSEKPEEILPRNTEFYLKPSQQKIAQIYRSTEVWLSTSNYEGFCLPCLEAMSSGAVPVSTDNLGVRDIIDGEVNGFIVERENSAQLKEKTEILLSNDVTRIRLRKAGILKSRKFSWENSANRIAQIFQETLKNNKNEYAN